MYCGRYQATPFSRREMLARCANGFGALALTALMREPAFGADVAARATSGPLAVKPSHYPAKAKNVIFLYMDGGPSQMDTFDPKPLLDREHGQPIKVKTHPTQFNNVGTVLKCPWKFRQYGESGIPVSDLFPHVAQHVDELAIIRSMVSNFSEHTAANYFLHTGSGLQGRPSHGAWTTYGLGSECQNLPGFVVLNGGLIPPGGMDCFSNGFLPAAYQGSLFRPSAEAIANIRPGEASPDLQRRKLDLLRELDRGVVDRMGKQDSLEAAIGNYELAYKMQATVPELTSLEGESPATRRLYGLDDAFEPTRIFARECLLARRLVERGVRFVEVLCPSVGHDRWDQHSDLKGGHERNALAVDRPIAGLLRDLKARGLLESTLVFWGGEFGRTPMAQGSDGRDHNPYGFTVWLAGGGVKGGTIYGATDDYGYHAVENKVEIHDLHATMLHLLGMDHTRLTVRFGGRDMRLTDVHGEIVKGIVA
ncbi:DUF1501 domain-containing protein [Paludisphaera borealis]|uniref:Sulfatase n=1 Tax=Paludisphaera borealis TaxID=1387353 RepID=A0A1U7CY12_9BACT|nr:DUF1501 domain-containing protein [Paludisphaera borealis]APW63837.1 hypothetical protein BSF38_05416 [Paludisphaera borealis]